MEDLLLNIKLEDLKKMNIADRAILMRKLIRRCQKHNNTIDCPSCRLYATIDCWFTEMFNTQNIKVRETRQAKRKLTYAENWEKKIEEQIKKWKEGKIK